MSSGATPSKLQKVESPCVSGGREDGPDYDAETQIILEELDGCQNELDALIEKASEEILNVEQTFNKLRKPYFEMRNAIIKKIPNFWVTAFRNHPQISAILKEDEEDCLQYLSMLEVEEFEDIKSGYRINFHFYDNPYLENDILTKEFHLGSSGDPAYSTQIRWKQGNELLEEKKEAATGRRRINETKSFFQWFTGHTDPSADDIAEVIKEDIWPNPLQYYLVPDIEDENGFESEEEAIEADDDDDDEEAAAEEEEEEEGDDDDDEEEEEDNDQSLVTVEDEVEVMSMDTGEEELVEDPVQVGEISQVAEVEEDDADVAKEGSNEESQGDLFTENIIV